MLLTAVLAVCVSAPWARDAAADQGRARGRGGNAVRQLPRAYQEPAFARGYSTGYDRGLADGRRRARYSPVDNRDYRNGDQGYANSYGSKDAYRSNYRAGFRQGYEDGYRAGTR
ncbi:MAG: hypothetical protein A3F70_12785 [Acidobacteria bacterium RIFCSPLOWO2_12_FULL_67_14]|nr:MAG: hypothetical protein A3F70_12785 [Acidobacteria bacterium RIFCSPLOWO2_12_FULL_67_14]